MQYNADKLGIQSKVNGAYKKLLDASELIEQTEYNAKITKKEVKTPSITVLATTSAFNAFKNRIPKVSDIVKKRDYDAKISDNEIKYFTTSDYNKILGEVLNTKTKKRYWLIILIFLDL